MHVQRNEYKTNIEQIKSYRLIENSFTVPMQFDSFFQTHLFETIKLYAHRSLLHVLESIIEN